MLIFQRFTISRGLHGNPQEMNFTPADRALIRNFARYFLKIQDTMKTKSVAQTRKYRLEMNDRILNAGHKEFNRFFALDSRAYEEGAIPVRMKELMGLVGSMVLRCNDCIFYHIDRSIQEGASKEELQEAFNIALIVGGSIVIPHLRYAFGVMDEIFADIEQEKEKA